MYTCTEQGCSRSFKRPEHLSRHRLNHQPRKIHQCSVCHKDFVRLDLLQRHSRRHDRGMAYRNSGGYSTRGRPGTPLPPGALTSGSSPATDRFAPAVDFSAGSPPGHPPAATVDPPVDMPRPPVVGSDVEHLAFFNGSDDATGLTQDLDWLFGTSPWDLSGEGHGAVDTGNTSDLQTTSPASEGSQGSVTAPPQPERSASVVPRERVLSALTTLPAEVLESSFFAVANLEQFMNSYWQDYNPHFSLLHRPSFSVQDAPPLLLIALLNLGATLSPDVEHYNVAEKIHQNLRWLIFTSPSFQAPAPLWVVQALLVVQAYEKMCSTRKLHEMSHIFHYSVITLMRRGSFYSLDREEESDISSVEKAWHRWTERESSYRAAYFAFVMDAQHASIFGHAAALSITDIALPLPCPDVLWEAPTAAIWNRERSRAQPMPFFLPALRSLLSRNPIPHAYSPFTRFVLLHGLFCLTRHMVTRDQTASCISAPDHHHPPGDTGPSPTPEQDNWKERMDRAIDTWSFSLLSQTPSLCLEAARPLQRFAHVSIHVSLLDFHILAGAPNLATGVRAQPESTQFVRAYKRISDWACHRNARRTLSHCLLLIQETMFTRTRYMAAGDNILLKPWVLYNMTLVLWAYGAITSCVEAPRGEGASRNVRHWSAEEYLAHMLNGLMGDDDLAQLQGRNRTAGLVLAVRNALDGCRWELLEEAKETLARISERAHTMVPPPPALHRAPGGRN